MATNYSNALKRVLAYGKRFIFGIPIGGKPKMIGVYMSKLQLQTLATNLFANSAGPDGIWFMIGKEGSSTSVELIPYIKRNGEIPIRFFEDNNGVTGGININIGGRNDDSIMNFTITGNGIDGVQFPPEPGVVRHLEFQEQITIPTQRTPPPSE